MAVPPSTEDTSTSVSASERLNRADDAARLAISAGNSGDLDEALHQWGKALELEPSMPTWWAQLGRIQMRTGSDDAALESYLNADRLRPNVTAWRIAIEELQWRCTHSTHKIHSLELSPAYYDNVYKIKQAYQTSPEDSIYLPVWKQVIKFLRALESRSIVDLGCGPGQFAEYLLSQHPATYLGYDFSSEAIEIARSRDLKADFIQSNIVAWQKPLTGCFDTVIATEFLEHVQDDIGVLKRLPNDISLVASVPNFDSFGHVRYFHSTEHVRDRYEPFLRKFSMVTVELSERSSIHVFSGRLIGSQRE